MAVEIDEKGHLDRKEKEEHKRENKIKQTLGCKFVRINPDKEKHDVFVQTGRIYGNIDEIKEKGKNEPIDKTKRKHKKYVDMTKKKKQKNKRKNQKIIRS